MCSSATCPAIRPAYPFANRWAEPKNYAKALRITGFALGVIAATVGALALCQVAPFAALGTIGGAAFTGAGGILLLVSSFTTCIQSPTSNPYKARYEQIIRQFIKILLIDGFNTENPLVVKVTLEMCVLGVQLSDAERLEACMAVFQEYSLREDLTQEQRQGVTKCLNDPQGFLDGTARVPVRYIDESIVHAILNENELSEEMLANGEIVGQCREWVDKLLDAQRDALKNLACSEGSLAEKGKKVSMLKGKIIEMKRKCGEENYEAAVREYRAHPYCLAILAEIEELKGQLTEEQKNKLRSTDQTFYAELFPEVF